VGVRYIRLLRCFEQASCSKNFVNAAGTFCLRKEEEDEALRAALDRGQVGGATNDSVRFSGYTRYVTHGERELGVTCRH